MIRIPVALRGFSNTILRGLLQITSLTELNCLKKEETTKEIQLKHLEWSGNQVTHICVLGAV